MKIILLIALLFSNSSVFAREATAPFKITTISVNDPGNMPFRVYGMPAVGSCSGGFAHVAENDATANIKISTLLAAFSAGKTVTLTVSPIDYFGNGVNYCQINVVGVSQ